MASSAPKDSFVAPEIEDISPPGVWSLDGGEDGSSSPEVHGNNSTPSDDEAAAKDEKLTWPFKKFSELAKSAKGKVTAGMLQFIQKHLKGTRLIFVVGLSGSGKTTLLGEITNQDLKKGHSARSEDMDQARDIAKELETSAFGNILSPEHVKGGHLYYHGVKMSDEHKWDIVPKRRRLERSLMAADFVRDRYERSDGVAKLQVLEELSKGWGLYETEAAASLFNTFSSSTICVLRHKALIMDTDEDIKPRVKAVERADTQKPAQKASTVELSAMRWWEIAKEVAWTFWGFRRTGNTKFTEYRRSTAADAWEKLKTWWSGEAPPQ
ncbi:hypothetical protein BDW72DRAFT_198999 [Aspergillus terricola var. indicus]